ncbi:uncharacterized protein LOC119976033 [Scyliorhinus canicula]|uniref:uncharacterized protein LOC119976033 n=1 Tax=Scyliorhinus canicula TaxID=7830 RepID=UPI0018F558AF|nr:uncharacterized protein LOC119976033 [Scyliorhinus canicula]XP_038672060.1 uncharacterized protein LOC119976033 [Scyliorhinus canicula]XP_038672061.1 uncharacterized protein LOC119976033 [Scyliorhinus canicula]XP_038672062.1 uncharacterized protein LOC119976033 [Scyliorhinus canicula]
MPADPGCLPAFILTSCLFAAGVHCNQPTIQQTPRSVKLAEGASVTMNCIINFAGAKANEWQKNGHPIKHAIRNYEGRVKEGIGVSNDPKVLLPYLRIQNLTECDSGTYYCMLETAGKMANGTGTTLTVTRVAQVQCSSINSVHIGVSTALIGVLCISLIIVSVLLNQRNKACIALQRQFVAYVTEKSTATLPLKPKGKHKRREGHTSSSDPEGKKKKRKAKERQTKDNDDYVHVGRQRGTMP